jgi:hypothetical protein
MHRDQPGLAVLAFPDGQHPGIQIDVAPVEEDRLADAAACDGQKPDQRLVGRHPQREPQRRRCPDDRGDLVIGVKVGCRAQLP